MLRMPAEFRRFGLVHLQLAQPHKVKILECIAQVLKGVQKPDEQQLQSVSASFASQLSTFAVSELTAGKVPTWPHAATEIMVDLSFIYPNVVLDQLLKEFAAGEMPHPAIVATFCEFASHNPLQFVPRMQDVLARFIPVLALAKDKVSRTGFARALGRFCEALSCGAESAASDGDAAGDAAEPTYPFASEAHSMFDVLVSNWLIARELPVRGATAEALGFMASALNQEQVRSSDRTFVRDGIEGWSCRCVGANKCWPYHWPYHWLRSYH